MPENLLETTLRVLVAALIYPGLAFLLVLALITESMRRWFAANAEGRTPPPFWQPWWDLQHWFKLANYIPAGQIPDGDDTKANQAADTRREGNRFALYALPLLGLLALVVAGIMLPLPFNPWNFSPANPLNADLLAISLLILMPNLAAVLLGTLGGSVFGQMGAARVFQYLAACILPYGVAVFSVAIAQTSLNLQSLSEAHSGTISGIKIMCGLLFLLCMPVLLRLRPFMPGYGETPGGITNDISGAPLALFRLMEWVEKLVYALFFAVLFVPWSGSNPFILVAGTLLALGIISAVDTLFAQVRLAEAIRFYFRYANGAALVLVLVASVTVRT